MATLGEVYEVLGAYRVELQKTATATPGIMAASTTAGEGPFTAFRTPVSNVHATGVGIRVRQGKIVPDEFVLKVFEKSSGIEPPLGKKFEGVDIDVERLPVQLAFARAQRAPQRKRRTKAQELPANRNRHRPIVGGLSIAPLNESYVGTLGCFVRRDVAESEQTFALSNNHVLADTNRLPLGTRIVQPGPERFPTAPTDVFAALSEFIPIRFPTGRFNREVNRFDAALAAVTDDEAIALGSILGISNYDPDIHVPRPGMAVVKSGRTTGITRGTVTAVGVNGVQVNYGTDSNPIIATFNETIEIVGSTGQPFSLPGDSGSVILEDKTGRPVALLFAGDGVTTTACSFAGVCRHFRVTPV